MRNIPRLTLWLLLSAVVIGTAVFPVSAGFYHPRGLLITTYPQQILALWNPQDYSVQLIVIIEPPWYFVRDLTAFDTLTLTVTLKSSVIPTRPTDYLAIPRKPMTLVGGTNTESGSTVTFQWTKVAMSDNGYGGVENAYLTCTITFHIDGKTATGFYKLFLTAQATAGDVLFEGRDWIGVSLRPGFVHP